MTLSGLAANENRSTLNVPFVIMQVVVDCDFKTFDS